MHHKVSDIFAPLNSRSGVADGRLHVTLNPASAPRRSRALAALRQQLNDTETVYPGTDLVLHYAIKATPNVA